MVATLVPRFDEVGTLRPQHVLNAVEAVEDDAQHALAVVIQMVPEDALTRLENIFTQGQELRVVEPVFFEGGGVLRPAQRKVAAGSVPGIPDKAARRGVAPHGVQRMNLQRQEVESRFGQSLSDDNAGNSMYRDE